MGQIEFCCVRGQGFYGRQASGSGGVLGAHKKVAELAEQKAKKKREEERYAIKQQMKLEEEEQERIKQEKQEEREKAEKELEKWKEEKRIKAKAKREAASLVAQQASQSPSQKIWKERDTSAPPKPLRKADSIQVHFTPHVFPTAARESKKPEEQEWLAKMAARRIKPPENNSDGDLNERNPEFLKDKGVEFFKAGNYEAAINAFSEAIKLNPNLPHLFSNRAACYLATGDNERCISDCCRALGLFYPVVPSNYASRTKVFVRRGTAYANVGSLDLALQDYDAALKLSPTDEQLRQDYETLKEALLRDTSE